MIARWKGRLAWLPLLIGLSDTSTATRRRGGSTTTFSVSRHSLYPDIVPDIAQNEGSGGPRPVASQSHCEGGQYLTSYMSL